MSNAQTPRLRQLSHGVSSAEDVVRVIDEKLVAHEGAKLKISSATSGQSGGLIHKPGYRQTQREDTFAPHFEEGEGLSVSLSFSE